MQAIDASYGLHAYKAWRGSLVALPPGTILEWSKEFTALGNPAFKPGQRYKIIKTRTSPFTRPEDQCEANLVYEMILVSKTGKEFKKRADIYVEGIARAIVKGQVTVLQEESTWSVLATKVDQ